MGHTAVRGPLAGLLWATPCMAHDGPHRLSLGPTWPKSALLFIDSLTRQRMNVVWDNLGICLGPVLLMTHACTHTSTGVLGLQVTMLGHIRTCPFPCTACSACKSSCKLQDAFRMVTRLSEQRSHVFKLPWDTACRLPQAALGHCQGSTGCWLHVPRLNR